MAKACGLLDSLDAEDQSACEATITSLKAQEVTCAFPASLPTTATQLNSVTVTDAGVVPGEEVVSRAQKLLEKLQINLPVAEFTHAASSSSA